MITAAPRALDLVLVAAGGAIGAALRAGLNTATASALHAGQSTRIADSAILWPATLAENIAGSFLLALLITALPGNTTGQARIRLFLGSGLLGSFTTFSALSADVHALGPLSGAALMLVSVAAGICAAAGGAVVGSRLARSRHPIGHGIATPPRANSGGERP